MSETPLELNRWGNTAQDRTFRNKTNENWDRIEGTYRTIVEKSETAVANAQEAQEKADGANKLSESVQKQFNQVVKEGDSSMEAAQARVDENGEESDSLKERIDEGFQKRDTEITSLSNDVTAINTRLTELARININQFPRLANENHDIPRVNRAITYLSSIGGGDLLFNAQKLDFIPQKPAAGDTTTNSNAKRLRFKDNVNLVGVYGKTIFKVSDNNPNYHAFIEEEEPNVKPLRNVNLYGITFDHNVYNNPDKPDSSTNNHKEFMRIYQSENVKIRKCKIICNGINSFNFRIGVNQEKLDQGIYPHKNLEITDNEIVFVGLDLPYYDNTFVTVIGDGVNVSRNKIRSDRVSPTQIGGENTAIEVDGRNIDCEYNTIDNYMLGIDVTTLDKFASDRNIKIRFNKINNCARGIKTWGGLDVLNILNGVVIDRNDILLDPIRYKDRIETSTRCGIGLANHTTASLGTMKNLEITNNKISMTDVSRDYLLSLPYPGNYYQNLPFDAHWNGMYFGGKNNIPYNITIKGNEFKNLPCPAVFTGHYNVINDVLILENTFIDCGYGRRSAILTFTDQNQNFTISKNIFLDKGINSMNGKKLYAFRDGSFKPGKFWEFAFSNNTEFPKVKTEYYENEFNTFLSQLAFDQLINDGTPNFYPSRIGLRYIDRVNKAVYVSVGTSSNADWVRVN